MTHANVRVPLLEILFSDITQDNNEPNNFVIDYIFLSGVSISLVIARNVEVKHSADKTQ